MGSREKKTSFANGLEETKGTNENDISKPVAFFPKFTLRMG